ncbi:MAG TPA: hypothetical protein VNM14_10800 [Planctomycetota bacterium]|nr:hypothetical protein [Planctomycetota bacterium]
MNEDRFLLLVEKYIDGALTDAEARELLEAPEPFRGRLLDEVSMAGLLARAEGKAPADLAAKVQAALRPSAEKDAMVARVIDHLPRRRSAFRPLLALAAAALILLTLYAVLSRPVPVPPGPTAVAPTLTPAPAAVLSPETKAAVAKAVDYLRQAKLPSASHNPPAPADDLVLWAMLNAGVPEDDASFKKLLQTTLAVKLQRTYTVSLHTMLLQRLDPVKYHDRIADCAQFLVDNQCINGQWSYGAATVAARSGVVKKTRDGPLSGNNSCSQFAAMALRACVDAQIAIPTETFERAARGWRECQRPEADGRIGWCYTRDEAPHRPYGSMTAGGVMSLVIHNRLAGKDWRQDAVLRSGLEWVRYHFTVTENFGPVEELMAKEMISDTPNQSTELYYWLWAVERAATVCGLEKLGTQDWYQEGVRELLATQRPDGSWYSGVKRCQPVYDTCYAILFLTRSTRPFAE